MVFEFAEFNYDIYNVAQLTHYPLPWGWYLNGNMRVAHITFPKMTDIDIEYTVFEDAEFNYNIFNTATLTCCPQS